MRHAGFFLVLAGSAAIGTLAVLGRSGRAEPALWLGLALAAAFTYVRTRGEHPVRYAFPATAAASLVAPLLQFLFFDQLLASNPGSAEQLRNVPGGLTPRGFVLVLAPVVSVAYAGVTSLLTLVFARWRRRAEESAS